MQRPPRLRPRPRAFSRHCSSCLNTYQVPGTVLVITEVPDIVFEGVVGGVVWSHPKTVSVSLTKVPGVGLLGSVYAFVLLCLLVCSDAYSAFGYSWYACIYVCTCITPLVEVEGIGGVVISSSSWGGSQSVEVAVLRRVSTCTTCSLWAFLFLHCADVRPRDQVTRWFRHCCFFFCWRSCFVAYPGASLFLLDLYSIRFNLSCPYVHAGQRNVNRRFAPVPSLSGVPWVCIVVFFATRSSRESMFKKKREGNAPLLCFRVVWT